MSLQVEQNQDVAQGSHLAESTREPPIIDPEKSLPNYQISCIVDSVYYYPDGRKLDTVTYTCAVVLDVGFLGENFIKAIFPTRVPGSTKLDKYPDTDEVVEMDGCTVREGVAINLNVQALGAGANLGGYNRQREKTVFKRLQLQPVRVGNNEIRWRFKNEDSYDYFPSAIKLLLLVRGDSSPRFPFTLEILPTLEVYTNLQKRKWHVWPSTIKLRPGRSDGGWSCKIDDDYDSTRAKGFLDEHKKLPKDRELSQTVGLRAALISYPTAPQG